MTGYVVMVVLVFKSTPKPLAVLFFPAFFLHRNLTVCALVIVSSNVLMINACSAEGSAREPDGKEIFQAFNLSVYHVTNRIHILIGMLFLAQGVAMNIQALAACTFSTLFTSSFVAHGGKPPPSNPVTPRPFVVISGFTGQGRLRKGSTSSNVLPRRAGSGVFEHFARSDYAGAV